MARSLVVCLSFGSVGASAQSFIAETAPQEPPYVEESEFDFPGEETTTNDFSTLEGEFRDADLSEEPAPETVNLNEESANGEEFVIEDEVIPDMPEESVVEVPTPEIEQEVVISEERPIPNIEVVQKSKKGGVEYIRHPQAANGLIAIEQDGTYIYRTKEDLSFDQTGIFRFGMMDAPKITSADGQTTFSDMYSPSVPMIGFDYEWQPLNGFGRWGIQAGFGIITASGPGRFVSDPTKEAKEQYTFIAIPLSLGGVYRMEVMNRQWFAPYISAGVNYFPVIETRDDNKNPGMVGTPGVYGSGGMMINLTSLDRDTAFNLRSEYGIANLWVTLDYRYIKTFSEEVDFTSGLIGGGIAVDY
jgi:hypothetical protein